MTNAVAARIQMLERSQAFQAREIREQVMSHVQHAEQGGERRGGELRYRVARHLIGRQGARGFGVWGFRLWVWG